ncbi:MAG: septum formation initiator family protein [Vicinamibacterales bacterium]|jgi:cell division protein FtsB|nr:septum formation initiator family protein [Vicinamibacterales bacterium]HJO18235.1 septum formation initiator family protein [Vicinamibacterales bacterium]|tara:strand:- start:272 stop:619 length:348 start_codon:yes stop_codon:yes gene_type:complete
MEPGAQVRTGQVESIGAWKIIRLVLWFATAFFVTQTFIGDGGLTDMLQASRERRALTDAVTAVKVENRRLSGIEDRLRRDSKAIEGVARGEMGLIVPGEVLFVVGETTEITRRPN